jgi:hypothetical protein
MDHLKFQCTVDIASSSPSESLLLVGSLDHTSLNGCLAEDKSAKKQFLLEGGKTETKLNLVGNTRFLQQS